MKEYDWNTTSGFYHISGNDLPYPGARKILCSHCGQPVPDPELWPAACKVAEAFDEYLTEAADGFFADVDKAMQEKLEQITKKYVRSTLSVEGQSLSGWRKTGQTGSACERQTRKTVLHCFSCRRSRQTSDSDNLQWLSGKRKNLDLAAAIRRVGFHVFSFHYSGSWGSEGDFSFRNCLEDIDTILEMLTENHDVGTDLEHVYLWGQSMGEYRRCRWYIRTWYSRPSAT